MNTQELRAERDFFAERHLHGDYTWVGRSSDALVGCAILGGATPNTSQWPSDNADLGRCEETYRRAPNHWKPLMWPVLERWRRHVLEGGLYCRGCDNSIGHTSTRHDLCSACATSEAAEVER